MTTNISNIIKDSWECPIYRTIMVDPVETLPCKHVFERTAIERWQDKNPTCPLDRREIEQLNPLNSLREETHQFINEHPYLFDNKSAEQLENELKNDYDNTHIPPAINMAGNLAPNPELAIEYLRQNLRDISFTLVVGNLPLIATPVRYHELSGRPIDEFMRRHLGVNFNDGEQFALRISTDGRCTEVIRKPIPSGHNLLVRSSLAAFVIASVAITLWFRNTSL